MNNFSDYIADIRQELDKNHEAREELLTVSRKAIQHSSLAIRHLHRKEIDKAEEILRENFKLIERVNQLAKQQEHLSSGIVLSANQEYTEAALLLSFMKNNPFPSDKDLCVPSIAYLHGIPDFIGELRRFILDSLRKNKEIELALTAFDLMDELVSLLVTLDYPDGLTHNLRKKTDFARNITEKTRGDITLALNRKDLVKTINTVLSEYLPEGKEEE